MSPWGGRRPKTTTTSGSSAAAAKEWAHGVVLGPFTVADSIPPGSLAVIRCEATLEEERHLVQFDPPHGLFFSSDNRTESQYVKLHWKEGDLPKVSCHTLDATPDEGEGSCAAPPGGGSTSRSENFGRGIGEGEARPRGVPPSDSALNASQAGFLLLLAVVAAYYCHRVFGPTPSAGDGGRPHNPKKHQPSRRKHRGGARGGLNRAKKAGGGGKKQGRADTEKQAAKEAKAEADARERAKAEADARERAEAIEARKKSNAEKQAEKEAKREAAARKKAEAAKAKKKSEAAEAKRKSEAEKQAAKEAKAEADARKKAEAKKRAEAEKQAKMEAKAEDVARRGKEEEAARQKAEAAETKARAAAEKHAAKAAKEAEAAEQKAKATEAKAAADAEKKAAKEAKEAEAAKQKAKAAEAKAAADAEKKAAKEAKEAEAAKQRAKAAEAKAVADAEKKAAKEAKEAEAAKQKAEEAQAKARADAKKKVAKEAKKAEAARQKAKAAEAKAAKSIGSLAGSPPACRSSSTPPSPETESTLKERRMEDRKSQSAVVEHVEREAAAATSTSTTAAAAADDDDATRPRENAGEPPKIETTENETPATDEKDRRHKEPQASTETRNIHRGEGATVKGDASQGERHVSTNAGDTSEHATPERGLPNASLCGPPPTITSHEEDEVTTKQEASEQEEIIVENKDSFANSVAPSLLTSPSSPPKPRATIVLLIEGMTCKGCVGVVDRVLNSFDEIDSVATDLQTGTSTVSCNVLRLNLLPILTALDDVGMEACLQLSPSALPPPPPGFATTKRTSPETTLPPCPVKEQQIKQQSLGAIRRPSSAKGNPLSLMDELRQGSRPLRRYRCGCDCEGCMCSASKVHAHDDGKEITFGDLCDRLETALGTTRLEETLRETDGGTPELRDRIERLSFPCSCGK